MSKMVHFLIIPTLKRFGKPNPLQVRYILTEVVWGNSGWPRHDNAGDTSSSSPVCFVGISSPGSKAELVNIMSESAKPMILTPWQRQDGCLFVYAPVVGLAIRYDRNRYD